MACWNPNVGWPLRIPLLVELWRALMKMLCLSIVTVAKGILTKVLHGVDLDSRVVVIEKRGARSCDSNSMERTMIFSKGRTFFRVNKIVCNPSYQSFPQLLIAYRRFSDDSRGLVGRSKAKNFVWWCYKASVRSTFTHVSLWWASSFHGRRWERPVGPWSVSFLVLAKGGSSAP